MSTANASEKTKSGCCDPSLTTKTLRLLPKASVQLKKRPFTTVTCHTLCFPLSYLFCVSLKENAILYFAAGSFVCKGEQIHPGVCANISHLLPPDK